MTPNDRDMIVIFDPNDWSGAAQVFTDKHEAFDFFRDHPHRKSCRVTEMNAVEGWSRPLEDELDDELSHTLMAAE
ncbi:MAG: hypothetical protein M9945_12465 [Aquamicrobium sp.]|uniref:hypothetical protein n=1 Tax=Aquamicrobium sp. TaxID=1872579 RepID=UPI00349EAD9E|nr:hypothetical protein [Aquamicrobium sp.]